MAKSKTTPPAAGPADKGLRVTAKAASFWRGGLEFTREARTLALAALAPEQAEAIRDEPMLVVEEVDIEAPPKG